MPRRILADNDSITIVWGEVPAFNAARVATADLHGSVRNKPNDNPDKLAAFRDALQSGDSGIDRKVPLTSLPIDDPDRTTDPATESTFWDGLGNLVTRRMIVVEVTWDAAGNTYVPTLRKPV